MADWNHAIDTGYENHNLHIIPVICFGNFVWVLIRPYSIISPMRFLMQAETLIIYLHNSLDEFRWLLQDPLAKFPALSLVCISKRLHRSVVKCLTILHILVFDGEILCAALLREQVGFSCRKFFFSSTAASVLFVFICFRFFSMDGDEIFKLVANSCKHKKLGSYRSPSLDLEVRQECSSNSCS